jgi:hypothetical protein
VASTRFDAQVAGFVSQYKDRLLAVLRESSQEVVSRAQTPQPSVKETGGYFEIGKIPVDTGFLRASFYSTLNGSGRVDGPTAYVGVIASAELGDAIFGGWWANYAATVNYGGNYPGRLFATTAAASWQEIVTQKSERFRS